MGASGKSSGKCIKMLPTKEAVVRSKRPYLHFYLFTVITYFHFSHSLHTLSYHGQTNTHVKVPPSLSLVSLSVFSYDFLDH